MVRRVAFVAARHQRWAVERRQRSNSGRSCPACPDIRPYVRIDVNGCYHCRSWRFHASGLHHDHGRPTDIRVVLNLSKADRLVTPGEPCIEGIFALVQGQIPRPEILERKIGQASAKTLDQAFYSTYVAEKVLPRFVGGSDRPDRHRALGLTAGTVGWAARRVREKYEGSPARGAGEDAAPNDMTDDRDEGEAPRLTWRHAFRLFFGELGPCRADVLGRLERQSLDGAPNVAEFAKALDALDEVDALWEAGRAAEAFMSTRRHLEAGRTCFASRHLAIAAAIAPDPDGVRSLAETFGGSTSMRFERQLQRVGISRLDAALGDTAATGADAFGGELPAAYAANAVPMRLGFEPDAATLWAALNRGGPLGDAPSFGGASAGRGVPPIAVFRARADASAEDVAAAIKMAEDGIALTLVSPAPNALRERLSERADITVIESFAEARALLAASPEAAPAIVCDAFAPVSREVFDAMHVTGAGSGPVAVDVTAMPQSSAPSGIAGIAGVTCWPGGLWAASGRALCEPLERAADRPAEAASAMEASRSAAEGDRDVLVSGSTPWVRAACRRARFDGLRWSSAGGTSTSDFPGTPSSHRPPPRPPRWQPSCASWPPMTECSPRRLSSSASPASPTITPTHAC